MRETIEEAAENNYPDGDDWTIAQAVIRRLAFKNGAKSDAARDYWFQKFQEQDKNKYSGEEVLHILHNYRNHFELHRNLQVLPNMFFEWFEQFKKTNNGK
jgi:hypothetical protein